MCHCQTRPFTTQNGARSSQKTVMPTKTPSLPPSPSAAQAVVNGETGHDAVYEHKDEGSWLGQNKATVAGIAVVGFVFLAALGVCSYRVRNKQHKSHENVPVDDEEEDEDIEGSEMVDVVGLTS